MRSRAFLLVFLAAVLGLAVWLQTGTAPAGAPSSAAVTQERGSRRDAVLVLSEGTPAGTESRSGVETRSGPEPRTAEAAPAERTILVVRVVDHLGRGVAARISVQLGRETGVHDLGLGDELVLEDARPGWAYLSVDPDSLPEESRPADLSKFTFPHRGLHRTPVEVEEGQRTVVELVAPPFAELFGWVEAPDGLPTSEVNVRAYFSQHSWSMDTVTDGEGFYRLRVPPGRARVSCWPVGEDHPLERVVLPSDQVVECVAAQPQQVDLVFEVGTSSITGRVVDQFGQPFSGLNAWLSPREQWNAILTARVDEDGTYRLDDAPQGEFQIRIHEGGTDLQGTELGLSEWVRPVEVTVLGPGSTVEVEPIEALRALAYRARGTITPPAGVDLAKATLRVVHPNGKIQRDGRIDHVHKAQLSADGNFSFELAVGHGQAGRLELVQGDEVIRTWPFEPEPRAVDDPEVLTLD